LIDTRSSIKMKMIFGGPAAVKRVESQKRKPAIRG
jgi:hypothetical protein